MVTLECILKARSNTKLPFELVIVETGTNYLRSFADLYLYEAQKTNATKSINRGFRLASGDYVVLLTNDVIVDEGWLEHLLEPFQTMSDCGLSTLASDQFKHEKSDLIKEGIWFSVAMLPKSMAQFDENFVNSWDDSDVVMRTYLSGKRMYRSFKSVVHHKVGMTHYGKPDHKAHFDRNRAYFIEKWANFKESIIYRVLVEGHIV
jgi:glycosyltransferase involved in cell wall biosynthesis